MIAEIGVGGVLALAGYGTLAPACRHVPAAARTWMSLPAGSAIYLLAAVVSLVFAGTIEPMVLLAVTGLVGITGAALAPRAPAAGRAELRSAGVALAIAVGTVLASRLLHMTRLTPDSLRYLLAATDLVRPDALSELNRADLVIRPIGLPALHAAFELVGRQYLASIGPLFGVFGLGFFVWFVRKVTQGLEERRRRWLVLSAVVFLGTSNRLVYDAFYINAHIQMAVYLLIAVSATWMAVTEAKSGWAWPAGLSLGATILLRPESPLLVAVVLIAVAASRAGWAIRVVATMPAAVLMWLWYGIGLWQNAREGDAISLMAPVFGSLVAVLGSTAVVLAGGFRPMRGVIRYADRVALLGMIGLVAYFGLGAQEVAVASAVSTLRNLTYNGLWLLTWVAALGLLIVALFVHRVVDSRLWTTPILGFALLFCLLPLLREGAYRVGEGDSGNRMLAHFLSIVVAFLVLAAQERPGAEEADHQPIAAVAG